MSSFEELVLKKIREHMNTYADGLATGGAQNFPDYRFQVGVIQGLAMAEREVLDVIETAKKSEDI
jgi:hypothetical protein|tara:strand:+ start:191 stop:385 length:195 start_codon:yes stop_codon:yes gene_type:complete